MLVSNHHDKKNQREKGDVSVFISLLIAFVITASMIILGTILARQIRASRNVISTERAFYAADTGLERALYELIKNANPTVTTPLTGSIDYSGQLATYESYAFLSPTNKVCSISQGNFAEAVRRVTRAGGDCVFPP